MDFQKFNKNFETSVVVTVITAWVKSYNFRMVQYKTGHKFVSSTERYEAFNPDDPGSGLKNFHPLR